MRRQMLEPQLGRHRRTSPVPRQNQRSGHGLRRAPTESPCDVVAPETKHRTDVAADHAMTELSAPASNTVTAFSATLEHTTSTRTRS